MSELRLVVAYDISSDRQRRKMASLLSEGLVRVQLSVFEGVVPEKAWRGILRRALPLLDPETDRLRVYHLCPGCGARTDSYGQPPPEIEPPEVVIL